MISRAFVILQAHQLNPHHKPIIHPHPRLQPNKLLLRQLNPHHKPPINNSKICLMRKTQTFYNIFRIIIVLLEIRFNSDIHIPIVFPILICVHLIHLELI